MSAILLAAGATTGAARAEAHRTACCADLEERIDGERTFEGGRGSASLIRDPTGICVLVAGGWRNAGDPAYLRYAQLGMSKPWLSVGKTTIYADRSFYKDFSVGALLRIHPDTPWPVVWGTSTRRQGRRWGVGLEQGPDAGSALLYPQAHFDPKIVGYPCLCLTPDECGGDPTQTTQRPAGGWQWVGHRCTRAMSEKERDGPRDARVLTRDH
jgi:hypothetical protein